MQIVVLLMRMELIEGLRVAHSPEGKLRSMNHKNKALVSLRERENIDKIPLLE